MSTTTITREVPRPTVPSIVIPDDVRPRKGDEYNDCLFVVAAGIADGLDQHREASKVRVARATPTVMLKVAQGNLDAATAKVAAVIHSGNAKVIREALLTRHEAAQTVEALTYRPPDPDPYGRSAPAEVALREGIESRAELAGHWAYLASDLNILTVEQWERGCALAAARVRPVLERLERARAVIEGDPANDARRRQAVKYAADTEAILVQVRSLAGLEPTNGAVV